MEFGGVQKSELKEIIKDLRSKLLYIESGDKYREFNEKEDKLNKEIGMMREIVGMDAMDIIDKLNSEHDQAIAENIILTEKVENIPDLVEEEVDERMELWRQEDFEDYRIENKRLENEIITLNWKMEDMITVLDEPDCDADFEGSTGKCVCGRLVEVDKDNYQKENEELRALVGWDLIDFIEKLKGSLSFDILELMDE